MLGFLTCYGNRLFSHYCFTPVVCYPCAPTVKPEPVVKEVPFKGYSFNGGSSAIIKPMTRKEYKEYRKRKRKKNQNKK